MMLTAILSIGLLAALFLALFIFLVLKHREKRLAALQTENNRLEVLCREMRERAEELEAELEKTLAQVKILISKML